MTSWTSDTRAKVRDKGEPFRVISGVDVSAYNIVSTDVFDTLLFRRPISERRRQHLIAERFIQLTSLAGIESTVDAQELYWARRHVQMAAYKVRRICGDHGDVQLSDIHRRVLTLCHLPEETLQFLQQSELEVEKRILYPNDRWADDLRIAHERDMRVIAISDTPLSEFHVLKLINEVAGEGLVDCVYSSGERNATKRSGGLFSIVLKNESCESNKLIHVGDDLHSDVQMAREAGISSFHIPRSRMNTVKRKSDGVIFELGQSMRDRKTATVICPTQRPDLFGYGYEVFGPIVTEACLFLWFYFQELKKEEKPVVLFCARGGLRIRYVFEAVLKHLNLPLGISRENFMVSRLVAARAALAKGSNVAMHEIARQFHSDSMRAAAESFAGEKMTLSPAWDQPFDRRSFEQLIRSESAEEFWRWIHKKNALFNKHIESMTNGFSSMTLIDTGLHGITVQMLMDAFPEKDWRAIMLARSNYRRIEVDHFDQTSGLFVEREGYSPFDRGSVLLKYWHLVESLFEVSLPSVTDFSEVDGAVRSNLEISGWQNKIGTDDNPLYSGILSYIRGLAPEDLGLQIQRSELAWRRFKRNILFPRKAEVALLDVGEISRDFGRDDSIVVLARTHGTGLMSSVRGLVRASWREGYAVKAYPHFYPVVHLGLWSAYYLRDASRLVRNTLLP